MDIAKIKKKIDLAIEIVSKVKTEYKAEAFGSVLSYLLEVENTNVVDSGQTSKSLKRDPKGRSNPLGGDINRLAELCKISTNDLENVLSFNNGIIQVIVPLKGSESDKQVLTTKIILLAFDVVYSMTWVNAIILKKCVDRSGVGDSSNFARTLQNNSNMFRRKGSKKGSEYKLIGPGRASAIQAIKELTIKSK